MGFLIVVVLVIIGRGKILPSEKPITIERNGQLKMHLAPGLNLAQPFLEAIVARLPRHEKTQDHSVMLCFKVQDKNISSRKLPFYLLEVSLRNGYLCFDAKLPAQEPAPSDTASLACAGRTIMTEVEDAARAVAQAWGIGLHRIAKRRPPHIRLLVMVYCSMMPCAEGPCIC